MTSKYPGVKQARILLEALTPDEIDGELRATDGRGNCVIHYVCIKTLLPWLELIIQHGGGRPIYDGEIALLKKIVLINS